MKKWLMLMGVVCVLTGCGGSDKKLTCTYDFGTKDPAVEWEYVFDFNKNGDTLKSYTQNTHATYGDDVSDEEFENAYAEVKKNCSSYESFKGVSCSPSKSGKKISVSLKVTMSELDEEGKKEFEIGDIEDLEGSSYDVFKKNMEASQFECK